MYNISGDNMFIRIADLNIKINRKYGFVDYLAKDYIIDEPNSIDIEVEATDEDIKNEPVPDDPNYIFPDWYLEALVVYRKISKELPKFNAFLLHGACFKIDDNAFVLCAKSGVGKSTHAMLLQKYLKDRFIWINGDKPIVRFFDNIPYIYGTPWCGKEFYQTNTKAICKAIGFIERSETNFVEKVDKGKVFEKLIYQIPLESDIEKQNKLFELYNNFINYIDSYVIHCNMDDSAAVTTYENIISKYEKRAN